MTRKSWRDVACALLLLGASAEILTAQAAPPNWRRLDINKDQRFDRRDVRSALRTPWAPDLDANGDGRKDSRDAWTLPLLLTKWDVQSDGRVNDSDAKPAGTLTLPAPDLAAAAALVQATLAAATPHVPATLEAGLKREWAPLGTATQEEQASLYEQAAAAALAKGNLEVAQWAFARAASLSPDRPSSLNSLGFTLAQQGKTAESLVLYVAARRLKPNACAVLTNIGVAYARVGDQRTAERYHRDAVRFCPGIGQYHLNLGATQLRLGQEAAAAAAFATAARLNPADGEAMIMNLATTPHTTPNVSRFRADYEAERQRVMARDKEAGEGMYPWEELSTADRIEQIVQLAMEPVRKDYQNAKQDLIERTRLQLKAAAKGVLPGGTDACGDLKRWSAGYGQTLKRMGRIVHDAQQEGIQLHTVYLRKEASAEISVDAVILQLALAEAQKDMTRAGSAAAAQRVFKQTVDQLYTRRMEAAARRMAQARGHDYPGFTELDDEKWFEAVQLSFMIPMSGGGDPQYAATLKKCMPKENPAEGQIAYGVQAGIAGIEYKPADCEVKVQVGAGILLAGTWSPVNGFGFQQGYGGEIGVGALSAGATHFTKYGSDGSVSEENEIAVGAGGAGWQKSESRQIYAAENAPVGSWGWAAEVMGCAKK